MLHLLDMFGGLLGIQKPVKFDTWFMKSEEPTVTPLLTSKACPEIQEDSY